MGAGPGSYNIHKSVWHVNCCSPNYNVDSGWGIFNARMYPFLVYSTCIDWEFRADVVTFFYSFLVLGWQNSATYSSVIVYNIYWIVVAAWFLSQLYLEKKQRRLDTSASQEADREALPSKYEGGATVFHGSIVEVK